MAYIKRSKSKTKFNVNKSVVQRTYNGVVYDSQIEMCFYRDFILPKIASGEITDCQSQVSFELQPAFERTNTSGQKTKVRSIDYVADYVITYNTGLTEVIDIKGYPDSVALQKRKMFWYKYPDVSYRWISYSKQDGGWIEYEDLKKARTTRKRVRRSTKMQSK